MRKLGFAVLYCVYLAVFVTAADYWFLWRPFVAGLRGVNREQRTTPRYVDEATMRRVGSLRADRRSSFTAFAREKPAGTLRVCALGDSFTYGDEAADGHDFPAFLGQIFDERGLGNVEVLSFGNPWYGFHQTYLLWDGVGRRFGCDVILLGPDGFQPERDTTFNHTGLAFPYYLHARYVLDGAGVRRVDVKGATDEERFAEYFAFVPRADYLRYDRAAPAFLRSALPAGRTLANPFYYHRGAAADEAYETYARLLTALAREPVTILLLHGLVPVVALADRVGAPNLVGAVAPRVERFPYAAPGGHYSSFGNRWVAEQYYALLTGGARRPVVLDFEDAWMRTPAATLPSQGVAPSVSAYDRIYVRLGDYRAGFLAIASADPSKRGGAAEDLARSSAVGLIALEPAGASIVDAAFVAVPTAPREGDRVVLRGTAGGELDLGTVHVIDARANLGVVVIEGLELTGALTLTPRVDEVAESAHGTAPSGGTVDLDSLAGTVLHVGATPVARAVRDGARLRLEPIEGVVRHLRVGTGEYAPVGTLADTGVVTLVLENQNAPVEVPIARWRKRDSEPFRAERPFAAPIAETRGRATLTGRVAG